MAKRIYVGGLPYSATEQDLTDLFSAHGTVTSVTLITDKYTGQAKGFGFVELVMQSDADDAIAAMNGQELRGRKLTVEVAKPKDRGPGHGAGGRRRW